MFSATHETVRDFKALGNSLAERIPSSRYPRDLAELTVPGAIVSICAISLDEYPEETR